MTGVTQSTEVDTLRALTFILMDVWKQCVISLDSLLNQTLIGHEDLS